MDTPALPILTKLARKLGMAVLIAGLTLPAFALWLFVRDSGDYEAQRAARTARVEAQRVEASAELARVGEKADIAAATLALQQQRALQIEKALKTLHELDPDALDRLIGDKAQQAEHDARLERTVKMKTETQTRIVELQRETVIAEQKRGELTARLGALEAELAELKKENHAVLHYLRVAWKEGAWWVGTVFFAYLFGGLAVSAALYYGWARLSARGKPLQLRKGEVALPTFGESGTSIDHMLWPGERLWVRRRFLQSSDAALTRKSRLLPDWRRPLSWWVSGFCGLIELRNERSNGERQTVLTNMNDPFSELVVVSVPEGGSFVVCAGMVKGLVADIGGRPVIRRHWSLRSWHAWVTGQFGYLEFYGPCRLVVSCMNELRGEALVSADENKPTACRVPVADVVGFSPQLSLHPVRSEQFWRYCRGEARLFELRLSGTGAYLAKSGDGRAGDGFKACVLKPFGL